MAKTLRTIKDAELRDKRVFLRTGWDVPLKKLKAQSFPKENLSGAKAERRNASSKLKAAVLDDIRIRESLPTIRYLLDHGVAGMTTAFHLDRPGGKVVEELSVRPVVERFSEIMEDQGLKVLSSKQVSSKQLTTYNLQLTHLQLVILENLRFDPREETNNEQFAKELAQGHDLYVNDAFSDCHRNHASIVGITQFLPAYAGLLVEDEITHLSTLRGHPNRPFVVMIGGAKIEDKMPVIEAFAKTAEAVLVGGKTGLEYLKKVKSQSFAEGNSSGAKAEWRNAKLKVKSNIFLPLDDADGFDIGPKTIAAFAGKINQAQTIFWNGNMGMSEHQKYAEGTEAIAEAIAHSQASTKIAGGGDTTAFIHQAGLGDRFTFLSSGGGATLDYLAGKAMPGLEPLMN